MDLYDIAVARKLSSGGGGGGSSDFSTAEVTVINNCEQPVQFMLPMTTDEPPEVLTPHWYIDSDTTGLFNAVLYKGTTIFTLYGDLQFITDISTTGSAVIDPDMGIIITGDCTITIS